MQSELLYNTHRCLQLSFPHFQCNILMSGISIIEEGFQMVYSVCSAVFFIAACNNGDLENVGSQAVFL